MKKLKKAAVVSEMALTLAARSGVEQDATYENVDVFKDAVEDSEGNCPGETPRGQAGDDEQFLRCSGSLAFTTDRLAVPTAHGPAGAIVYSLGAMFHGIACTTVPPSDSRSL